MKLSLLLLSSVVLLSGCQLTRVEGRLDNVDVKVGTDGGHGGHHSRGKFCPPGQAKKGAC